MEIEKQTQFVFEKEQDKCESSFKAKSWGVRHNICLLLFFTYTIGYSLRACLGVALVGMVHKVPKHSEMSSNETVATSKFGVENGTEDVLNFTTAENVVHGIQHEINAHEADFEFQGLFNSLLLVPPYPTLKWTKKMQDAVNSAFFWGYTIMQIPSGQLAHRFGPRYVLAGALLVNCLMTILFPVASYYGGYVWAILSRMCQGIAQASILPGIHTVMGKWSPFEERGRMIAIILGGSNFGAVLGMMFTGFISASWFGWPGIFYFYGLISGIIGIFLWTLMANSPGDHKKISVAERRFIQQSLGQTGPKKKLPIPWKILLTTPGVLAIVAGHVGHTWGNLVLYAEVPSYLANILGVNIKANGMLSALPFLLSFFSNIIFSWVYDMLLIKKYLNVTQVRKLANSIGCIPPAIGLILLGYVPQDIYYVETILVAVCVLKVSLHSGFFANHVDIAPNYAGPMMSLSNFVSNLIGGQAPLVAGFILTDVTDVSLWRIVFFITAALYFFTNLVFLIWGTAERAEWNDPPQYQKVALDDMETTNSKKDNGAVC